MVTHLEELCFWLFLVNAGSAQQDWFRSLYFKTWLLGSALAVTYMPLVTIFTRADPLKCEAYTFLAGSLGSLSLTLWFIPVLWTFPSFLRNLTRESVDSNTIIRLTKFHELNSLRILFRFLFVLPLVTLGVDGVRPHQHVNESMMWTDLLAMISGLGFIISSGITLVIFFPRSIEGELAAKEVSREKRLTKSLTRSLNRRQSIPQSRAFTNSGGRYLLTASPVAFGHSLSAVGDGFDVASPISPEKVWMDDYNRESKPTIPIRPNRRTETGEVELGGLATLSEENLSRHNQRQSKVNHLVHNFTSPIDLAYAPHASRNLPMDVHNRV